MREHWEKENKLKQQQQRLNDKCWKILTQMTHGQNSNKSKQWQTVQGRNEEVWGLKNRQEDGERERKRDIWTVLIPCAVYTVA